MAVFFSSLMHGVGKFDAVLANVKKLAAFGAQAVLVPGRINGVENARGLTVDRCR